MTKVFLFILLLIGSTAQAQTFTVERIVNGNTIELTNGQAIRLIGVEIPDDKKISQEATDFLNNWIEYAVGRKVYLEYDIQKTDQSNNILAYVYIDRLKVGARYDFSQIHMTEIDGDKKLFCNATIIKAGYARPISNPPNVQHAVLFQALSEEARADKRGLWGDLENNKPRLTKIDAIEIALRYWEDKGGSLEGKPERDATYDQKKGLWRVSFDSVIKRAGSRFFIMVNDEMGKVDHVIKGR